MKRIIALILLATLMLTCVAGALSSCNTKSKVPPELTEIPDGGYDGSEVTITFYHTMGAALTSILTDAITAFNELYPNITVQHQSCLHAEIDHATVDDGEHSGHSATSGADVRVGVGTKGMS